MNKHAPFGVSVIIPLYNKEKMVERCIVSVLKQRLMPSEIIVVDDGSKDSSREIVERLFSNISDGLARPKLRILRQDNRGVSAARNVGIESAMYEYVALLDADDEWEEDFLSEVFLLVKRCPDASMYSTFHKIRDVDGNFFKPYTSLPADYCDYLVDYFYLSKKVAVVNSSKVVLKKQAVIEMGGFPLGENLTEDLYLWFRLALNYKVAHLNKPLVIINQFPDESRASRKNSTPYIISYFIENKPEFLTLTEHQKKYLFSVYYKHFIGSLVGANYREAVMRFRDGAKVFGIKASLVLAFLFFPPVFFNVLRRFSRRNRSKREAI